ncbi:MAG TPA: DUF192 domain-containing protein [Allosphingosinicella sp.]|nr:DUF192 domain-containing protein [Allosphingosinicella sp.]
MKKLWALPALALLAGCGANSEAPKEKRPISTQQGLERMPLQIRSGDKVHKFEVEVAATPEQQATGLMFVERLGPDEGMLFPFNPPRPASFWMKNTLIPLDMIFVRPGCTIARIAVNTIPQSLDPVGVEEPVSAVLELAGGRTAELGIKEGDCVVLGG